MVAAAVALCRATRYRSAGTVEYIVDASTFDFYFLEMNTRIQVEHPVTEMVTGVDLVAMQIDLARGRLAVMRQDALTQHGHAIEARLYAENPAKKFLPSPGRLERFVLPHAGQVRVDCGYREGDTVTPFYDPMVAKIVVRGGDRNEARRNLIAALKELQLEGIRNNRDFLIACLVDDVFAAGDVSTNFIDSRLNLLLEPVAGCAIEDRMVVTKIRHQQNAGKANLDGLRQLGFTDYEARIYVQLLKLSPATAYEVSKAAGVPRANAYAALEALARRGAVLPVTQEPLRYVAAPPKALFESISRQTRVLCSELSSELSAFAPADQDSYVWTAHGDSAVQGRIEAMIAESRRSIWIKAADDVIRRHKAALQKAAARGVSLIIVLFGKDPDEVPIQPQVQRCWRA